MLCKMLHLEISAFICYLIIILLVSVAVKICIVFVKYVNWSWKIFHTLPGTHVPFFNILSCLPRTKNSENGSSLLVHINQAVLGLSKLFNQEKLYHLQIFIYPVVVLGKAEALEAVFNNSRLIEKPWFVKWLQIIFGTSLINSGGDLWRCRRRFLKACFRKDILNEFMPIMNEQSRILVESLKTETREDFTKISRPMSECTLNITREIVCGIRGAENSYKLRGFYHAVKWGMRFFVERLMNVFLWLDFIYFSTKKGKEFQKHVKTVKDVTGSIIKERKQKYLQKEGSIKEAKRKPLLDLLIDYHLERNDFSENDVSDELVSFMTAGQDATAAALSWTLYMLGLYQDIQAQVHNELDLIFGDDPERYVTQTDLNRMKYLKCVIKETLRLYPPVYLFARELFKDINICGYQIPRGTTCVVLPHALHRDEEVFPDSERFIPDRFSQENSQSRNSYAYVPFSVGPRKCIGQNLAMMKLMVIISTILRNYTLESLDQRDKILPTATITITPSKPIRIRIRERHSKVILETYEC
ncbi:Cytochrome P450 4V2 like protein [Argiope bruennichi]|uniref:Cytochrome P450 4V2 like protein n=1 Tax=Argiope bruennichi TaxID=94029 RepID=A0A8T0F1J2_ARGBR|nr:Cytochrome P450 4V2 like protein [Argiope bruennichi]